MIKNNLKLIICVAFAVGLGFVLGKISQRSPKQEEFVQNDIRDGQGKLTNPLLECAQSQDAFLELKPFKSSVQKLVDTLEAKNEINNIAVYFRDLNNGPWFGIDDQMSFAPASLLKVPLAIAYYKLSESNPDLLSKEIVYNGTSNSVLAVQVVKPREALEVGVSYSVEELIRHMLVYSDNQAYLLLIQNIDLRDLSTVYKDFGFDMQDFKNSEEIVNIQNYSSFFRILYNASYISSAHSEKILSILSESDFHSGLVSSLPKDLTVAHKFGERGIKDSEERQFSDCGIIYYPGKPYLLCIATKGTDFAVQSDAIDKISALVFNQIKAQIQN